MFREAHPDSLRAVGDEVAAAGHLGKAADLHAELALRPATKGTAAAGPTTVR
jgi:hypothetical protein